MGHSDWHPIKTIPRDGSRCEVIQPIIVLAVGKPARAEVRTLIVERGWCSPERDGPGYWINVSADSSIGDKELETDGAIWRLWKARCN